MQGSHMLSCTTTGNRCRGVDRCVAPRHRMPVSVAVVSLLLTAMALLPVSCVLGAGTKTHSDGTASRSLSMTTSVSPTATVSPSATVSPTESPDTATPSQSTTWSSTDALTVTQSPSATGSPTNPLTATESFSAGSPSTTLSPTVTATVSASVTPSLSPTPSDGTATDPASASAVTPSLSSSPSISNSSVEPSATRSLSLSMVSPSASPTSSPSATITPSLTLNLSTSRDVTPTKRLTPTASATASAGSFSRAVTETPSSSEDGTPSRTSTITPPPTPTKTQKMTSTNTFELTVSTSYNASHTGITYSAHASLSVSESNVATHSLDSLSRTRASLSPTDTVSPTASGSASPTRSTSPSSEQSPTLASMTATLTLGVTQSRMTASMSAQLSRSDSVSISIRITPTVAPPTTTHVPTPSQTLLTMCPPCGNGTCTDKPPFVCQCFLSYKLGFWSGGEVQGATCTNCLANFYGRGCRNACPGGICTPCNNHGTCFDDVTGNGTCACHMNSTVGFWTGTSCNQCADGHYGPSCRGTCACDANKGTCREGISGNGTCACVVGRSGDRCDACATGYYLLPNEDVCVTCPGFVAGAPCHGHGACDPTTGVCYCTGEYTASSNCSTLVPGTINGCNPSCVNNATCQFGACVCLFGFVGPQCQGRCPLTSTTNGSTTEHELICGGHGTCTYDGIADAAVCECFPGNASNGFYALSSNCTTCTVGYGGTNCASMCPGPANTGINNLCSASVIGQPVASLCNATTATCMCPYERCGPDCSITVDCNGVCPASNVFGLYCNQTCYNGTTVNLRNASGRCICDPGVVGTQCDVRCGCSSNTTGSCPYNNATCVCAEGYAGPTCAIACPRTANGTCSGNGLCNQGASGNGLCRCNEGFVNVACQTPCRCVNLTLGSCSSDGVCVCAKSTWRVGDDCGSCQPGRAAYDCRTQCLNGTTNGTRCMCASGFGGVGCDRQCPATVVGGRCNGHGTCSEGDTGTGRCQCNESYVGPSCNCTDADCLSQRPNSKCDASTGQCTCVLPFGGSGCTDCATRYWGYSCQDVCRCVHGTCDRVKGTCTCFSNEQEGYWDGALCSTCQSGYNLPDCLQVASISTQLASFQSVFQQGKLFFSAKALHIIDSLDVAVAMGPVVTVYANISKELPTVLQQVAFTGGIAISSECTYAYSWLATASPTLVVNTSTGVTIVTPGVGQSLFVAMACEFASSSSVLVVQEYPVSPLAAFLAPQQRATQQLASNNFNFTIPRLVSVVFMRFFRHVRTPATADDYLAAAVTVDYDYSGSEANALYTVNMNAMDRVVHRVRTALPLSENLEAVLTSMTTVVYHPVNRLVLLVGSFDVSGVGTAAQKLRAGVYVLSFEPDLLGTLTTELFLNQYQLVSFATLVKNSTLLVLQVSNGTQDLLRINISNGASYRVSYPSSVALSSVDSVTGAVYDSLSGVFTAVANNGKTFKILRLLLASPEYPTLDGDGFLMLGSQLLPSIAGADRRVIDAQASFNLRQLYLLQLNASGTTVRRFLMYENLNVFPTSASRFSGPVVTITGRGFTPGVSVFFPGNTPRCRVVSGATKYEVTATVVSSTVVHCRLDASNTSLCSADVVEVAIYGNFFTTSQLSVPRFQQPQLLALQPTTTRFLGDGVQMPSVIINGSGFVDAGHVLCRWTPQNPAMALLHAIDDTPGTVLSSTLVNCTAPALPRAMVVYANVACDGFIFTSEAAVGNAMAVVGAPHNITTSLSAFTITSGDLIPLPVITVSFVDDQGSSLLNTVSERVEVTATFEGGLVPVGELNLINDVGVFSFASMLVVSPTVNGTRTGVVFRARLLSTATVAATPTQNWVTRVQVTVVSGSPDHLAFTNQPSVDAGIPESNTITTIEVSVEDVAGNRVVNILPSNASFAATVFLSARIATGVELPLELFQLYPATEFPNVTSAIESGAATFSNLLISNARGGLLYTFVITTNVSRASDGSMLSISTAELIPKCNAGKLRFLGDTSCRACPSFMSCPDATSNAGVVDRGNLTLQVSVSAGYWRSSVYATEATVCTPAFACVGGLGTGACALGYAGPLCGLCASTHGRSIIGGDCVECFDARVSAFLLFLVVFAACTIFILLTIAAAQNWAVTMEPIVSIILLLTHLQSVLGVGLTGFNFSQFFKDCMSYLGIFSSRVLDYFFSDCVLIGEGMTFYNKIIAFAVMPLFALLLASIAWLVVFLAPKFLRYERARSERHVALTARRDELVRRLSRRAGRTAAGGAARMGRSDRLKRIADQAELAAIEDELKHNLKAQGVLSVQDYRLLAAHALQVVLFFTFHTVVYYALTVFDCKEVPTGLGTVQSFLETDNRISCDSDQYRQYIGFGYVVSLSFFVLVPLLYVALYRTHLLLRPAKVLQRRQLSYVWTMGLKTGSWYWPAVVLIRKGVQFAVAAAVASPADAHVSVWLFCAQLIWLLNLKPYWNHSNTLLEAMSLVSCLVASSMCILFEAYDGAVASRDSISSVMLTILILPVPVFVLSATQKVWMTVREEIRALRFESSESESSDEDDVAMRRKREVAEDGPGGPLHGTTTRERSDTIAKDGSKGGQRGGSPRSSKKALRTLSLPAILRREEEAVRQDADAHMRIALDPTTANRRSVVSSMLRRDVRRDDDLDVPLMEREVDNEARGDAGEIPGLAPLSWSLRGLRRREEGSSSEGGGSRTSSESVELMGSSDDDVEFYNNAPPSASRGGPSPARVGERGGVYLSRTDYLDETARRVFEEQLRHDEASRRERAFEDLMLLEEDRAATTDATGHTGAGDFLL